MSADKRDKAKMTKQQEERETGRVKAVRVLTFCQMVRLPGMSGASNEIVAGKADGLHRNALYVDTIFEYGDDYVINGEWFIPKTCGSLLGRKY